MLAAAAPALAKGADLVTISAPGIDGEVDVAAHGLLAPGRGFWIPSELLADELPIAPMVGGEPVLITWYASTGPEGDRDPEPIVGRVALYGGEPGSVAILQGGAFLGATGEWHEARPEAAALVAAVVQAARDGSISGVEAYESTVVGTAAERRVIWQAAPGDGGSAVPWGVGSVVLAAGIVAGSLMRRASGKVRRSRRVG